MFSFGGVKTDSLTLLLHWKMVIWKPVWRRPTPRLPKICLAMSSWQELTGWRDGLNSQWLLPILNRTDQSRLALRMSKNGLLPSSKFHASIQIKKAGSNTFGYAVLETYHLMHQFPSFDNQTLCLPSWLFIFLVGDGGWEIVTNTFTILRNRCEFDLWSCHLTQPSRNITEIWTMPQLAGAGFRSSINKAPLLPQFVGVPVRRSQKHVLPHHQRMLAILSVGPSHFALSYACLVLTPWATKNYDSCAQALPSSCRLWWRFHGMWYMEVPSLLSTLQHHVIEPVPASGRVHWSRLSSSTPTSSSTRSYSDDGGQELLSPPDFWLYASRICFRTCEHTKILRQMTSLRSPSARTPLQDISEPPGTKSTLRLSAKP